MGGHKNHGGWLIATSSRRRRGGGVAAVVAIRNWWKTLVGVLLFPPPDERVSIMSQFPRPSAIVISNLLHFRALMEYCGWSDHVHREWWWMALLSSTLFYSNREAVCKVVIVIAVVYSIPYCSQSLLRSKYSLFLIAHYDPVRFLLPIAMCCKSHTMTKSTWYGRWGEWFSTTLVGSNK